MVLTSGWALIVPCRIRAASSTTVTWPSVSFIAANGGLTLAFQIVALAEELQVQYGQAFVGDTVAADLATASVQVSFGGASAATVGVGSTLVIAVPTSTITCTDTLVELANPIALATDFTIGGTTVRENAQPIAIDRSAATVEIAFAADGPADVFTVELDQLTSNGTTQVTRVGSIVTLEPKARFHVADLAPSSTYFVKVTTALGLQDVAHGHLAGFQLPAGSATVISPTFVAN